MTNREFFTAIVNSNLDAELVQHAKEAIEKLDKRNESRSSKPSKTAIANEPIKEKILEFVKANPLAVASVIGQACEISTQKAVALCGQLVEDGKLVKSDVKVPKKGTLKAFSIVED